MVKNIKSKIRGKGRISARVYRKATDSWEDLGVISTTKLSFLEKIKKGLGLKVPGEMTYKPLPNIKAGLKESLPKIGEKVILRVLSKSVGEDEVTYNCLLDDGSIETVSAELLEEVES